MQTLKENLGKSCMLEDGRMVLMCDKGWRIVGYPMVSVCVFILLMILWSDSTDETDSGLWMFSIVLSIMFVFLYFDAYKIVILSQEGATIKIGKYERFFRWSQFNEKRLEKAKNDDVEVVFSVKSIGYMPEHIPASWYAIFCRPFKSFYARLDTDYDDEWAGNQFRFSRILFCRKMEEWNIELEEVEAKWTRRSS